MTNRPFVFVETLDGAIGVARRNGACIATDNPLLAHDPRAGRGILDMSRYLAQPEATRLGHATIDTLLALDSALERAEAASRYGGLPGPLNVTLAMRGLLTTLVQRGLMAQRALADHGAGSLVLAVADQPRWEQRTPWALPRYACPLRSLAETGYFGNRAVEFEPIAFVPPTEHNDT
ncbi:MAG: hypothetical protein ACREIP_12325, partial [Alphaproteobacteria bacterium]